VPRQHGLVLLWAGGRALAREVEGRARCRRGTGGWRSAGPGDGGRTAPGAPVGTGAAPASPASTLELVQDHDPRPVDLEGVRALLGHGRLDTTQLYTRIQPARLKRAVGFYEARAESRGRPSVPSARASR
jgi:hypothetical protein